MNNILKWCGVIVVASMAAGCAGEKIKKPSALSKPSTALQFAEQRMAERKRAQLERDKYQETLATAVRQESRNESWATGMENKLQRTFADSMAGASATLTSTSCKTSRCEIAIETGSVKSPKDRISQRQMLQRWIALSQPCAYTMLGGGLGQDRAESIRIFIHCRTMAQGVSS